MIEAIPHLQIRSKSIVAWNSLEYSGRHSRSIRSLLQQKSAKDLESIKTYTGELREGSKKRLTRCTELLVQTVTQLPMKSVTTRKGGVIDYRLVFITLTIPDNLKQVTGKEAHKYLLEPLLLWMRRYHNTKLYIWKAELQKRGQLHYHITCDSYIHYLELQTKWNQLLKTRGLYDNFFSKTKKKNPPSTKIHAVRSARDMAFYLQKEITKVYQNTKSIEGKVWDCCLGIKKTKFFSVLQHGETADNLVRAIRNREVSYKVGDRYCLYNFKTYARDCLSKADKQELDKHLLNAVTYVRKKPQIIKKESVFVVEKTKIDLQLTLFSSS